LLNPRPGHVGNWTRPTDLREPPCAPAEPDQQRHHLQHARASRARRYSSNDPSRLSNSIDDKDVDRLAAFDTFRHLELLDLAGNRLTPTGIARAETLAREVLC
jgi:hypothetical protein